MNYATERKQILQRPYRAIMTDQGPQIWSKVQKAHIIWKRNKEDRNLRNLRNQHLRDEMMG